MTSKNCAVFLNSKGNQYDLYRKKNPKATIRDDY